jgi:hypothetical protein
MGERGFDDLLFENLRKPVECLVHFDQGVLDGGGTGRSPKEVLAHLGRALERKELDGVDIGQERFEVRTVLDRNGRFRRKGCPDCFPATRTAPDGTAMLGRDQRLGRQIKHLSRLDRQTVFLLEWSGISTGTSVRQMDKNPVRRLDRRKGLSGMSLLSSRLPVSGRTKTLGRGLEIAVR